MTRTVGALPNSRAGAPDKLPAQAAWSKPISHSRRYLNGTQILRRNCCGPERINAGDWIEEGNVDCALSMMNAENTEIQTGDDAFGWIKFKDRAEIHREVG